MRGLKILVIDDDPQVRDLIQRSFSQAGGYVIGAENGKQGLRWFHEHRPDLVILDVMMPEIDGWETCRQIRLLSDVPIVMLTALDQDEDVIRGLDAGADDFVTKPFSVQVLLARARASLRRVETDLTAHKTVAYDDGYLSIDLARRRVMVSGKAVKLTPKEYRLLEYLLQYASHVRTFQQILENVWGWAYQDSVEYVHVYISHLRQKLAEDPKNPRYLRTEHGVGYRFENNPSL